MSSPILFLRMVYNRMDYTREIMVFVDHMIIMVVLYPRKKMYFYDAVDHCICNL